MVTIGQNNDVVSENHVFAKRMFYPKSKFVSSGKSGLGYATLLNFSTATKYTDNAC